MKVMHLLSYIETKMPSEMFIPPIMISKIKKNEISLFAGNGSDDNTNSVDCTHAAKSVASE